MLNNPYSLVADSNFLVYEFDSIGKKGRIKKSIQFTQIGNSSYYNLGFGDIDPTTGEIDDLITTNNGDFLKVLETVAQSVLDFFKHYPKTHVIATGSTDTRTRLYRIMLNKNLQIIKNKFDVFGLKGESWYLFEPNVTYEVYLIKKKISKFE